MDDSDPDVIVVGGGPAGMMAALLLARAGVNVTVLEKHADFLRDFRGDTVHPSTMQILAELGLLERFLLRPHHRLEGAAIDWEGRTVRIGDLTHLRMAAPFIAMMPQWHFLDFLRDEAMRYPGFSLRMECEVAALVEDPSGRVSGVRLADGKTLAARHLVLMCDGRGSLVRGDLPLETIGAPIDVLWFAVPKHGSGNILRGAVRGNRLLVLIDRDDYWQCAFVIPKGSGTQVMAQGIASFRDQLSRIAPELGPLEEALPDFSRVSLLSVTLDRLTRWHRPGLLAIGDAAHAMSPVGGVGINLAIQDAVCTANELAARLARGGPVDSLLPRIQRRRMLPTRLIQAAQAAFHRGVLQPLLAGQGGTSRSRPPLAMRVLDRVPPLQRIPGRLIGGGIRQEHVRSPAA